MDIPKFENKSELFEWLKTNKSLLIDSKKSQVKHGDLILYAALEGEVDKADPSAATGDGQTLAVKAVINTTNVMDSHQDVHIKGIWKKTLKDNKGQFYLLQEHKMTFDKVIAYPENVKATTEEFEFKKLGFKGLPGTTEALIFAADISKEDNPEMFRLYSQNKVRNHSVSMTYVKIFMAVNSDFEDYKEEKGVWDKYIDQVANRKTAEDNGYFFAVTEAKITEGSAVPIGSNQVTPTLEVEAKQEVEPLKNTQATEPPSGTHKNRVYY